jgi:hypothetical protein
MRCTPQEDVSICAPLDLTVRQELRGEDVKV